MWLDDSLGQNMKGAMEYSNHSKTEAIINNTSIGNFAEYLQKEIRILKKKTYFNCRGWCKNKVSLIYIMIYYIYKENLLKQTSVSWSYRTFPTRMIFYKLYKLQEFLSNLTQLHTISTSY